jgi:hypothetical protein
MSEIKSLADQLRNSINKPVTAAADPPAAEKKKEKKIVNAPPIIEALRAYDLSDHKNMVHVRFETQTAQTLHHLKMATGIEVNKVVAYAVKQLLNQHPELKSIIKQHLQKLEL